MFFSAESGLSSSVVISIFPRLIRKGHPSLVLMPASPHKQHSTNSCPSPILLMMGILFSWTNMSLIRNDKDPLYRTPFSDLIRFPPTFLGGSSTVISSC